MRNRLLLVASLTVSLLCAAFTYQAQTQGRQQWEYKLLNMKLDGKTEAKLNELGAQGWELVAYDGYIANGTGVEAGTFMLKRPK